MRRVLCLMALLAAIVATVVASPAIASTTGAATFVVPLSGPGGSGTAYLELNPSGRVCYVIEVTLTTAGDFPQEPAPGIGDAHIHVLSTGGIAIHLDANFQQVASETFVATDCVRADKDVVRAVLANPDQYYVNIHTAVFPAGAVSGTLA